jgi:hypothetical protein
MLAGKLALDPCRYFAENLYWLASAHSSNKKELSLWRETFTLRADFGNIRLMAALRIVSRAEIKAY